MASSLGWFNLDFWWELAALVTIMLFGHWLEMSAIGQARGALDALAKLLPDEAERISDDGSTTRLPLRILSSATECSVGPALVSPPTRPTSRQPEHHRRETPTHIFARLGEPQRGLLC